MVTPRQDPPDKHLPQGVIPTIWRDGSTTYSYKGKSYGTLEQVPAPSWDWLNKFGEGIQQTVNKVPGLAQGLKVLGDVTTMPGEDAFAEAAGQSAQMWGVPHSVGKTMGYLAYPGPGELKAFKGMPPTTPTGLVPVTVGANTGLTINRASQTLDTAKPLQMVGKYSEDLQGGVKPGDALNTQGLQSSHTKLPEITRPSAQTGGKRTSLKGTNPLDDLLTEVTGIQNRRSEWLTPTEKAKLAGDPDPYINLDPKIARKYRVRDSKIQARMEQLTTPHLRNDQVGQLIRNAQSLKQKDPRLPRDFWSDSWWNLLGLKGERHHVAGLNWADSLFSNVTADTADQMRAYALKHGVEFGDVFKNRADLPIDVHKKLHAWLTKHNLDGGNVKFKGDTFAERKGELDKLIEGVKASQEWIRNWRVSNNIPIPTNNVDLTIDRLHDQAASYIDAVDTVTDTKKFR